MAAARRTPAFRRFSQRLGRPLGAAGAGLVPAPPGARGRDVRQPGTRRTTPRLERGDQTPFRPALPGGVRRRAAARAVCPGAGDAAGARCHGLRRRGQRLFRAGRGPTPGPNPPSGARAWACRKDARFFFASAGSSPRKTCPGCCGLLRCTSSVTGPPVGRTMRSGTWFCSATARGGTHWNPRSRRRV